jgi:hypothetical protein
MQMDGVVKVYQPYSGYSCIIFITIKVLKEHQNTITTKLTLIIKEIEGTIFNQHYIPANHLESK